MTRRKDRSGWMDYAHSMAEKRREETVTSGCKCTLHQRTVGDGCDVCNPAKALEYAGETIADLERQNTRLRAALKVASTRCEHVHHAANERHGSNDPCPVEARIRALSET